MDEDIILRNLVLYGEHVHGTSRCINKFNNKYIVDSVKIQLQKKDFHSNASHKEFIDILSKYELFCCSWVMT